MWYMSCVVCHLSYVTSHMLPVTNANSQQPTIQGDSCRNGNKCDAGTLKI